MTDLLPLGVFSERSHSRVGVRGKWARDGWHDCDWPNDRME